VETEVTDATDPRRLGVVGTADTVERRDGVGGRGFESEVRRRLGSGRFGVWEGAGAGADSLSDFSLPIIHHTPEGLVATL